MYGVYVFIQTLSLRIGQHSGMLVSSIVIHRSQRHDRRIGTLIFPECLLRPAWVSGEGKSPSQPLRVNRELARRFVMV